jgi:Domain of unknown function (DUF1816)
MNIQSIWSDALNLIGQAWWVEINTDLPRCTYYFGPFATVIEADANKFGYIEDLEDELAQGIQITIKRCQPVQMTIDYESEDIYRSSLESQLQC